VLICEGKTQSVVIYRFNNGSEKRYKASHALNVEVLSGTSSNNKQCYKLEYTNLLGVSGIAYICSSNLQLIPVDGTTYVWVKDAEGRFSQFGTTEKSASISIVTGSDIPEGECSECIGSNCSITFKDLQGNTLYRETGDCPITWKYSCDDDCPEGYLKCDCDQFPGFKCVPCSSYLGRLEAIDNNISRLIK
jgi:hypothetical protein